MRVLVCGGRAYGDYEVVKAYLDRFHKDTPITVIIQGGATGADYLGKTWAIQNNIKCLEYLADWKKYKKLAGFLRNAQMIDHGAPDVVIGFPGGNGTADMISRAIKANILTYDIGRSRRILPGEAPNNDFRTLLKIKPGKQAKPEEDA